MSKKTLLGVCTVLLLAVAGASFYKVGSFYIDVTKAKRLKQDIKTVLTEADDTKGFSKEDWNNLKELNDDVVGYMLFSDNWIAEPIVQGTDNVFYLYHSIDGSWSDFGSIYLDASNKAEDQNKTIYGHNIFMEGDLMFTPLTTLVAQDEFEKHHSFQIYWEDHFSCYEITHVYYWDEIYDKDFDYKQTTFTDLEFDDYLNWLDQHNEIVSEETLSNEHCFVSLQTCKDLSSSVRIIITAKEITRETY